MFILWIYCKYFVFFHVFLLKWMYFNRFISVGCYSKTNLWLQNALLQILQVFLSLSGRHKHLRALCPSALRMDVVRSEMSTFLPRGVTVDGVWWVSIKTIRKQSRTGLFNVALFFMMGTILELKLHQTLRSDLSRWGWSECSLFMKGRFDVSDSVLF